MALPDFLVAGVPKSGTTALHAALARHPGLFLSPIKEPKFFLTDGPPPTKGGPGDALTYREHVWQRDRYEALFDAAPAGTLRGESTPLYLYDPAAMARIRQTIPAGLSSDMQRHHHETVHYVISGDGHSEIEDETASWSAGDFIYTPPWTWHRHYNDSADAPVEFLTIENSRLLALLGVGRRQSAGLATIEEARARFGKDTE